MATIKDAVAGRLYPHDSATSCNRKEVCLKRIPLKGRTGAGLYALVDDDIWEDLVFWPWYNADGYAVTMVYVGLDKADQRYWRRKMHSLILGRQDGYVVDHINGNPLDNRRSNLRYATTAENLRNSAISSRNRSGFKGVYWRADRNKWIAAIQVKGRTVRLGHFDTPLLAAIEYNRAATEQYGDFARLNIIPGSL